MKFMIILSVLIVILIDKSTGNEIPPRADNELIPEESFSNQTSEFKEPIVTRSIDGPHDKETQMAQCTVSSGDVKVSAQATFSVKGFCLSRDVERIKETIYDIEARLLREIYQLRSLIERTLPPNQRGYDSRFNYYPESRYVPPRPTAVPQQNQQEIPQRPIPPDPTNRPNIQLKSLESTSTTTERPSLITQSLLLTTTTTSTTTKVPAISTFLKSLESSKNKAKQKQANKEIDTLQSKNEYIYYWKLNKFPNEFKYAKKHEIFSHVFNVKGLFLRIRAVLKFEDEDTLYMDVEHLANVDNSEKMEFEVNDGLVFKEIAEEKLFQFSFVIMDQKNGPNHDLISPIYWNTDSDGFSIQNSVDVLSNYLKNETLLIKLIISF